MGIECHPSCLVAKVDRKIDWINRRQRALLHPRARPVTWNRETFALRDLDGRLLSMFEKTTDANDQVSWSWIRDYVYRGDKLLAQETSLAPPENRLHLHLDHLGSVRGVTDSNGVGNASFHYFAYGELINRSPAGRLKELENPLQFTGHERDFHDTWTADLDYMHARYYSPYLGRFLSVDPINSAMLASGPSWNKYSYSLNNPLQYVDPDGMESVAILAMEQDNRAFLRGEMTADDLRARRNARAAGAATGVGVLAVARFIATISPFAADVFLADDVCSCDDDQPEAPAEAAEPEQEEGRARERGMRLRSTDNPSDQFEEIEEAQRDPRKKGPIDSIEKSEQRENYYFKRIKKLEDAEEDPK